MLDKLRHHLGLGSDGSEADVDGDGHLAESRATGGTTGGDGDAGGTTGTGVAEDFVGRKVY